MRKVSTGNSSGSTHQSKRKADRRRIQTQAESKAPSRANSSARNAQAESFFGLPMSAAWQIVDLAMDAIITIDERQRVVQFNSAAERMFQCKASDVMGQTLIGSSPKGTGASTGNIFKLLLAGISHIRKQALEET